MPKSVLSLPEVRELLDRGASLVKYYDCKFAGRPIIFLRHLECSTAIIHELPMNFIDILKQSDPALKIVKQLRRSSSSYLTHTHW